MKLKAKRDTTIKQDEGRYGWENICDVDKGKTIELNLDDFEVIYACSKCGEDITDGNKKADGAFKLQHRSCPTKPTTPKPEKIYNPTLEHGVEDKMYDWMQQVTDTLNKIMEGE